MLALLLPLVAQAGDCQLRDGAYVLTVEPGHDVQTVFGHTALLLYDDAQSSYSPVYDWGRFEDEPLPSLAAKVLTMTKEYYLASSPLEDVLARYDRQGRGVTAQRLELSAAEARQLDQAVASDLNSGLRFEYNWYEPNCTTMVRDHVDRVVGGSIASQLTEAGTSPAAEVLRHSAPLAPLWLGLEWGSGRFARQPVSRFDAAFLPDGLHDELAAVRRDGRPLVGDTCVLGEHTPPGVPDQGPSRVGWLAVAGLAWGGCVAGGASASARLGTVLVGLTGLGLGAWGSAALLVGGLGTFAPFWGHHNLLLASPLHLLLVVAAAVHLRDPASKRPQQLAGACLVSGLLGLAWSMLGMFSDGNLGLLLATLPPVAAATWVLRPRS